MDWVLPRRVKVAGAIRRTCDKGQSGAELSITISLARALMPDDHSLPGIAFMAYSALGGVEGDYGKITRSSTLRAIAATHGTASAVIVPASAFESGESELLEGSGCSG